MTIHTSVKMKRLTILFLISAILIDLNAQEEPLNSVQLGWGFGHLLRQDLSFSPMEHSKWSPGNFQASYERKAARMTSIVDVGFKLYKPSLTEPFEFYWEDPEDLLSSYPHSFKQLDVSYSFLFPIYETARLELLLGGRQRNRLVASDYLYAISSSFSYYFSFGMDLSIHLNYKLGEKNRLGAAVNATVFAFNSRSPYLGLDDQYLEDNYSHSGFRAFLNYVGHARPQSYGTAQDLELSADYERILSGKWSLTGSYNLSLNFNQSPTTYASICNVIFLGAKVKF